MCWRPGSSLPLPGNRPQPSEATSSWRACLHRPRSLSSRWGHPALSSHPGARSREGGATEHRAQARPAHVLWGLPVQTHWGSPGAAGADLGGAARGSRQLGSWAVPPAPRALDSRSVAAPIPVAPCARARHRTPGCSRPLRPREPPRPQEQTGRGEPPGPGPSWSLPRCSCKGGLPLVPTEAASPSPPRPTLGTGLCAGEVAGEGQAAACQPVAATLNGLSSHGM